MIFLDFDGVIFDTIKEAYAVSVISIGKYNSIEEIDFNTEHYVNFKKLRYLISPAWNYKYLLEALESHQNLLEINSSFSRKIETAIKDDYNNFETNFFNTRNYLKKEDYKNWSKLNIAFPFFYEIKFLFSEFKDLIYIITTKDKATVLKLLSLENIEFDSSHIFDKKDYEKCNSKRKIIEQIIKDNENSIFIDDSNKHLLDCREINNLKCFQPEWGYVSSDSVISNSKIILSEINNLIGRE